MGKMLLVISSAYSIVSLLDENEKKKLSDSSASETPTSA